MLKISTEKAMKNKGLDQLVKEDVENPETPAPKIWPDYEVKTPAQVLEGQNATKHTLNTFVRKKHEGKFYLFPIVYALVNYNDEAGPTQYDITRVQFDVNMITQAATVQPGLTIEDPNQEA